MYKLGLENLEITEIKLTTFFRSWEEQESSRKNVNFFFINYTNAFDYVDHGKLENS